MEGRLAPRGSPQPESIVIRGVLHPDRGGDCRPQESCYLAWECLSREKWQDQKPRNQCGRVSRARSPKGQSINPHGTGETKGRLLCQLQGDVISSRRQRNSYWIHQSPPSNIKASHQSEQLQTPGRQWVLRTCEQPVWAFPAPSEGLQMAYKHSISSVNKIQINNINTAEAKQGQDVGVEEE